MNLRLPRLCSSVVVLAAMGACPGPGMAQVAGGQVIRNYGFEQGLGNLSVHCLAEDAAGFVWVGTEDGLYRFSGREFTPFGQGDGLPSATVRSLLTAPDGRLWVGTPKGLACWDGLGFKAVPPDRGIPTGGVRALAVGPGGKVLVGMDSGLFERVSRDRFRRVDEWPGGGVTAIWGRADAHEVWLASWDQANSKVFRWAAGTWAATEAEASMRAERIDALALDAGQRLWARSRKALWVAESAGALSARPGASFRPGGPRASSWPTGRGGYGSPRSGASWSSKTALPGALGAARGCPPP